MNRADILGYIFEWIEAGMEIISIIGSVYLFRQYGKRKQKIRALPVQNYHQINIHSKENDMVLIKEEYFITQGLAQVITRTLRVSFMRTFLTQYHKNIKYPNLIFLSHQRKLGIGRYKYKKSQSPHINIEFSQNNILANQSFLSIPKFIFKNGLSVLTFQTKSIFNKVLPDPQWRVVQVLSPLVYRTPFVVCFIIKDSKLVPYLIGANKSKILQYMEGNKIKVLIVGALMTSIFLFRKFQFVKNELKSFFSYMRTSIFPKREAIAYAPLQINDSQKCVVCYAKCRNIIFKNCRHQILCNDCLQDGDYNVKCCPLCRSQVRGKYIKVMSRQ